MIENLVILPVLLFSVVLHELAHGWMALKLGDPTARDQGRLTLNPIPHIDLFGSILIPLLSLAAAGSVFIAWAKPVPVNPANFSNPRRDDILVSAVGPITNLVISFGCTLIVIALVLLGRTILTGNQPLLEEVFDFLKRMFYGGIFLNIVLAVFNLIPVPPLDGSHLLASVLPSSLAARFRSIGFFGVFVLIALMRVPFFNEAFRVVTGALFAPFRAMIAHFLTPSL
jgi:Zn-dependent protease